VTPTARPSDADVREMARGLSEGAKADIRDGNCILGGEACVCGSSIAVKGELAHHRLASFPSDLDRGCLLNENGLALRRHLMESQHG